jgi:hypothetical protein
VPAKEDAEAARGSTVERLSDITKTPTSQLKYVMDAWSQVRGGGAALQGCGAAGRVEGRAAAAASCKLQAGAAQGR